MSFVLRCPPERISSRVFGHASRKRGGRDSNPVTTSRQQHFVERESRQEPDDESENHSADNSTICLDNAATTRPKPDAVDRARRIRGAEDHGLAVAGDHHVMVVDAELEQGGLRSIGKNRGGYWRAVQDPGRRSKAARSTRRRSRRATQRHPCSRRRNSRRPHTLRPASRAIGKIETSPCQRSTCMLGRHRVLRADHHLEGFGALLRGHQRHDRSRADDDPNRSCCSICLHGSNSRTRSPMRGTTVD